MRHRKILRDNILGIKNPELKRIAYMAGANRIEDDIYEKLRNVIQAFLKKVCFISSEYISNARIKTVKKEIVDYAIESSYKKVFYDGEELKKCKLYQGKRKNHMKFYQDKSIDCVQINKVGFVRLVKEMMQDFKIDVNWSARALTTLHISTEMMLIELLGYSVVVLLNREGKTLRVRDIETVQAISPLFKFE